MAMRRPKPEMPSSSSPPPPPPPSDQRDAVIQELRMGAQLAEFLRQQVELIPELDRRDAALANVGDISTALTSSLSVLQSERDIQQYCSSSDAGAAAHAPRALGGGSVGARNGAVARNRKAKHRRGRHGEELPIKEILTETPENDRFHWRKYGEKKILNAAFPRLYYRCGYSDEHKCPAKKYVQQQNNSDPPLFLVTLINDHTCETLFPADQPHCSSSSANSQVLDFTKASLSSPIMAAPAAGVLRLKKEEDVGMSVTIPSYAYDNQLPSSLPFLSPKQWEMEMDIKGIFRQDSGDGNLSS